MGDFSGSAILELTIYILELCLYLFRTLRGRKLELQQTLDRFLSCLAQFILVIKFHQNMFVLFLEQKLRLLLFFDPLFSLDEMKVSLIAALENTVLKSNVVIVVEFTLFQFVVIVHIELSNGDGYLTDERGKIAVSKILGQDDLLHFLRAENYHFFTL